MSISSVKIRVTAKIHEDARVIATQFKLSIQNSNDMSRLVDAIAGGMRTMVEWADAKDVIIGHVKSYISWDDEAIMLSTTGAEVQVKGAQTLPEGMTTADVGIAAIVFSTDLKEASRSVSRLVKNVLAAFGKAAVIISEAKTHDHHERGRDCGCSEHAHDKKTAHHQSCSGHDHTLGSDHWKRHDVKQRTE
jgi:hypothetical protein